MTTPHTVDEDTPVGHSPNEKLYISSNPRVAKTDGSDVEIGGSKTEGGQDSKPDESWANDPDNPRNWSSRKKWGMTLIVSMYTFLSPLASTMMAPALGDIAEEFRIRNSTVVALTLSIYLLAIAVGPLFIAPLSEIYGRKIALNIGIVLFVIFSVACALAPNTAALIIFRFLTGLAGSGPLAIGGGSISDVFDESERGAALGVFMMGPLLGPILGPVAGGFAADDLGQEWIFWILAILAGAVALVGVPLLQETYAPVIIAKKFSTTHHNVGVERSKNLWDILTVDMTRPIVLLTTNFICFILSLYTAAVYGFMYLLLTTFTALFTETYGWSVGISGLGYLGLGVGFILATIVAAKGIDRVYTHLKAKNNGIGKPEYRMPIMFGGSVLIPVGLLWYGWSADRHTHWIVPVLGSSVFGFGVMLCFLPVQVYVVDCFKYAASASAAAAVTRSLFGFAFPLFADQMFVAMGVGGGYSLLAGLALVLGVPFPLYIYYRGEKLRSKSNLTR